jgi:hypothetical protein
LRTQAGYAKLDFSIVKNPEDPGWTLSQWRDAVKDGGTIVMNTTLNPQQCRERFNIRKP